MNGFYCEVKNELVQVTSDTQLLEFVKELPAPCSLLPWSDTVDESVGINAEGTVDNDLNLNGGDTNHNESKSDLLSTDSNVDDIPVKMIQMPMKN